METRKFLDEALVVLRDALQTFFRSWWQDPNGQQWFKKATSKMKYASGEDRQSMNEADVLVLLNILTNLWESDFGPRLDPLIKKQKQHNYKTFRGKVELLKQYRHDHAHMNEYDIREVLHRVQDIHTVIAVLEDYTPDIQHHVEKMSAIEEQVENAWFGAKKQKHEAHEQGAGANIPEQSTDAPVQAPPEAEDTGIPDTEEAITPEQHMQDEAFSETPIEDQNAPTEVGADVKQEEAVHNPEDLGASPMPETPPISPNMPIGSEEHEPTTQQSVPPMQKKGFFSRFFGSRREPEQETVTPPPPSKKHDLLALRNQILDDLINVLREAKNPNQATFKAIHVLVWAAEALNLYEDYFITHGRDNIGLPYRLGESGLTAWMDFPIEFKIVSDLQASSAPVQNMFRSKGFYIDTVGSNSPQIPHGQQVVSGTCTLEVVVGTLVSRRKTFVFNQPQIINIGRKREVTERGIIVRQNHIAFQDTSNQKVIHKKHAQIKFDTTKGGFVLVAEGENPVAIWRATTGVPIYADRNGVLLVNGDVIQLSVTNVATIKFTQTIDPNA
ncbi:MAG TPA: Swt1 family HEPN domain-containing protein [Rhodothermales bacterium]|nr:hypothetical protein [Bacteroidota bacterium]HRK73568.1 Swt1 family HEPN domain-containing protein [Rhodothermales bacterium]HRR10237.1 Swt1 family HEPN domain-containing protein [Rhodothermales bacterium]